MIIYSVLHLSWMSVIRLEHVSKRYIMGEIVVPVLRDVNLKIDSGEFIGLFGPSGSGKTTLLNLIAGIDRPTEGRIVVDSKDITTMNDRDLTIYRRTCVGYIFQFYNLIPTLTALENVELALELKGEDDGERAKKLLRIVGLSGKEDRFPSQLSGGEQQRVAIARAVVKEPLILVGDEPTGNLDSRTSMRIISLLKRLNTEMGITILIATHDLSYRRVVGRVLRLDGGRVR